MRDRPWWRGVSARYGYVAIGVCIGLAVSLWSVHRGTERWVVWTSLAIGLTAASGAVFGYGLARWPEIVALGPIRAARVVNHLTPLMAAGLMMLAVSTVVSAISTDTEPLTMPRRPTGLILVIFAALAASPVAAGLAVIREQAATGDANGDDGRRLETLLVMRRLLAGYLAALGAQVTLATLALGAAPAEGGPASAGVVVVFGATSSLLMALAYAPAAGAVRAAARDLCRALVPLTGTAAPNLPTRLAQRRELEQALGIDRGLLADLQSGVVVIAPLLASPARCSCPGRETCQPVVQGRILSGLSTAQMCLIRPPAMSNAITVTVTPSS